jgi:integrase
MVEPAQISRRRVKRWRWGVPHVDYHVDRHGTARWSYRQGKGSRTPLPEFGTDNFLSAWKAAHAAFKPPPPQPIGAATTLAGTFNAALVLYYQHATWTGLASVTAKKRRQVLERIRQAHGNARLRDLQAAHIQALINKLKPNAQKNWSKALVGFFKFAVLAGLIDVSPMAGVVRDKAQRSEGFTAWTEDDLQKYRAFWPSGTRQRLAIEIMVNLGLRRSDACRIGPSDIRDGYLQNFQPQKTANSTGVKLTLRIRPELAAAIAAMTVVSTKTFMVGEARGRVGQPFKTGESFGAWMRTQCDAAGLPEVSSHGLRKLAAIRLALAGATVPMLCKVFGWSSPSMAQVYVDQADQMRMADQAMDLLDAPKAGTKSSPNLSGLGKKHQ